MSVRAQIVNKLREALKANTFTRALQGEDGALILLFNGLVADQNKLFIPLGLVLKRDTIEVAPTLFNVSQSGLMNGTGIKEESALDLDTLLSMLKAVSGDGIVGRLLALKSRFATGQMPYINFVIAFRGRVLVPTGTAGAGTFGEFCYRPHRGNLYITFLGRTIDLLTKLWHGTKILDIVEHYRVVYNVFMEHGVPPHELMYVELDEETVNEVRSRRDNVDDAIDVIIGKVPSLRRVNANSVFIVGIDESKKDDKEPRAFIAPAKRVLSLPLDAVTKIEVISNTIPGKGTLVVMHFEQIDIRNDVKLVPDNVFIRVVRGISGAYTTEFEDTILQKWQKTFYGTPGVAEEETSIEEIYTRKATTAVPTAEETGVSAEQVLQVMEQTGGTEGMETEEEQAKIRSAGVKLDKGEI